MKKILLLLFILICYTKIFAQLDTDHWFAAMYDGQINSGPYQYLYLSTDETTPFTVDVYSNNKLINRTTISKGNPDYLFIPRQFLIVNNNNKNALFTPINMGLNVKAEKRFYANLRIGMENHAEIVPSKGAAALGKEFYTVVAPLRISSTAPNIDNSGFQASVIATEDNTTVTINKFNKPLTFTNGTTSNPPLTFKLNKGQSYIIDGRGIITGNRDGFIGTKIVADKPISMTNGNFNGQYVVGGDGSDILMDQSVPVQNLGNEFGLISGMGIITGTGDDITNNGMERAIIVATKNNTNIYINNSGTPVKTINEGEYYFVPDTYYAKKDADHYNLSIKTSENVYVYQVLGGVIGSPVTGSMNLIPPLGCYLPRKIDEIGFVDQLNPNGVATLTVKLNIIAEKGAKVTFNGTYLNPAMGYGPFALEGNSTWETYSVPDVKGNVTVESDKAVNVGLAGGDGNAVGYAGYFAGFSAVPFISKKQGVCIGDVILELPSGYDYYQWFIRNEVTGLPEPISGATTYFYKPTKPGVYTVEVKRSVCPKVTTPEFKLLNCTTISTLNVASCNNSVSINPTLSNSGQATDWNSVNVIEQPTKGNLNIDKINQIFNYTPVSGASGIDTFKYNVCGVSTLPDCEEVKVTVYINIIANDATLIKCKINATQAQFDLTKANITADPSVTQKKYYKTQFDADNDTGLNLIPTASLDKYISEEGFVYVKLKSSGCEKVVKIELRFFLTPELFTDTYEVCDSKFEGKINVELDKLTNSFLKNHAFFKNVKYYSNSSATTELPNNWSYSANTVVYMKVESPDGCTPTMFPITFKIGSKVNVYTLADTTEICDDDFDNKKLVQNLDDYKKIFTTDAAVTSKFYINKIDAQNNASNHITEIQVNNQQLLYIRLFEAGVCDRLVELTLKIKIPQKSTVLLDKQICPEKVTTLDAGQGFWKYDWYNELDTTKSLSKNQTLENIGLGNYFVILTAFNGCTFTQKVKITSVELPEISEILIQNNTVTIKAIKGNPPYLYSLDGINYQASNVFTNVSPGYHKAYVVSKDDCKPYITEFTIIEIYNVLTPNGDGYNDVLNMSLLDTKVDVKFYIHDPKRSKAL
ncbi:IgGFc-binding protein [Epilithonimonas sp. UC225_85]|uniref:IgGFc-binding protein n=1 Tax=Epilithonimonas sp. UC225_85 TaxID=3350167 RepID=UPI0036D2C350